MRALAIVKHGGLEPILFEACKRANLSLEIFGAGVSHPINDVEKRCSEVDIVFATARTALEAMAAGAAVLLMDGRGLGGLVTTATFDFGRRLNFGAGMLKPNPKPDDLVAAIQSYDPGDAQDVTAKVKRDCDLDQLIRRLESIYSEVIRQTTDDAFDPDTFREQTLGFLRQWVMTLQPSNGWLDDRNQLLAHQARLADQIAALSARNAVLEGSLVDVEAQNQSLAHQLSAEHIRVAQMLQEAQNANHNDRQLIETQKSRIDALTRQIQQSERARSVRIAKALRRIFRLH